MVFLQKKIFYLALLLCAGTLGAVADSSEIKVGITESELLAIQDNPVGQMSVGSKTIYKWDDLQVWVYDGKVSKVKKINPQLDEVRRQQALQQARATEQREQMQQSRAQQLRQQQVAQNVKRAEGQTSKAEVDALVQSEVERWKVTKAEVARKGYKYGKRREWDNLYNQYIAAYRKEQEAIFDGNRKLEKAYAQSRSRLELQLNKLTDEKLDNDDTIDIRQEHYTR